MSTKNTKLPANWPTEETIKKWKEKHDNIHIFEVRHPETGEAHFAFLRDASIADSQRAIQSDDHTKGTYAQSLYNNCKLQADPVIESNEAMMRFVYSQIHKIVKVAEGSVKKL